MKIGKSKFTFLFLALVGLVVALTCSFFLPEKFFIDAYIIILDKYNEIGLIGSYPFSMWFYHVTGLKNLHFSVVGLIQYPILVYILYKIGVPRNFHKVTLKNLMVYLTFLLFAIYISMPSKEFITFIYIAAIIFLFKNKKRTLRRTLVIAFAMLFFFAFFFREYFAIAVILAISMYLISFINFKNRRLATISTALVVTIFLSLSYGAIKGKFFSEDSRHTFNQNRIERNAENANSMIIPPLDPDTWYGESFGIVYGFFSVNLPVNGIKHFLSPQILAFLVWQTIIIIILFIRYKRSMKEGRKNNYELWLFYLLFSYFVVQGVFEPDLGSAIRHKIGIFPLIYYLLYYEDFRKKLS